MALNANEQNSLARLFETLDFDLGLQARSIDEAFQQSQVFGLSLGTGAYTQLTRSLELRLSAKAYLETGFSESSVINRYNARREVRLLEAAAFWTPAQFFSLGVGALSPSHTQSAWMDRERSFPGIAEKLLFELSSSSRLNLRLQQSIVPTPNRSFLAGSRQKSPPTLLHQLLRGEFGDAEGLFFAPYVSYAHFANLSGQVAFESQYLGNNTVGNTQETSRFTHKFHVIEAGFGIEKKWSETMSSKLQIDSARNIATSFENGHLLLASLSTQIGHSKATQWKPEVFVFRMSADVIPAYYATSRLGGTNRQGAGLALGLAFPQSRTTMEASYRLADPIDSNTTQRRLHFLDLELHLAHDFL